jgi:hypothetical protein
MTCEWVELVKFTDLAVREAHKSTLYAEAFEVMKVGRDKMVRHEVK